MSALALETEPAVRYLTIRSTLPSLHLTFLNNFISHAFQQALVGKFTAQ